MITEGHHLYSKIFFHTDGDATDPDYIRLKAAFERLIESSFDIASHLGTYYGNPVYITITPPAWEGATNGPYAMTIGDLGDPKVPYIDGTALPAIADPNTGALTPNKSAHLVVIPPSSLDGEAVHGFDADFTASLDRVLFHELFHMFENRNELSPNGDQTDDFWKSANNGINFSEELAVFAENFLYASSSGAANTDTGLRLGHAPRGTFDAFGEGGASGTSGFSGFQMSRTFADLGDTFTFRAQGMVNDNTKTYHRPGYDLFGDSNPLTTYDHYIRYDLKGGYLDFNAGGNVQKTSNLTAALPDVMFDNPDDALAIAGRLFDTVGSILDPYWTQSSSGAGSIRAYATQQGFGYGGSSLYADAMVTRFVGIGADRWTDVKSIANADTYIDISGPVQTGSAYPNYVFDSGWDIFNSAPETTSASRLAINDKAAMVGAVLAGASGYTLSAGLTAGNYVNASESSDWLEGGHGSDVLLMGTGGGSSDNPNHGYGNDGNDVLIGREGIDKLYGGAGRDMFSPGAGADHIDGGADLDTLSYHESASKVWLNLTSRTGLLGDAEGDTWTRVERFIGSSHDDTFIGVGGAFMAGMEGNDTFHLKDGDVAFGGADADTFFLELTPGSPSKVGIIDLDPSDRIYINGALFQGWGLYSGSTYYNATSTGFLLHNGDVPGYPLMPENMVKVSLSAQQFGMYPPTAGPSGPMLDIFVAGYTSGDGGLNIYPTNNNSVIFPFQPTEFIL